MRIIALNVPAELLRVRVRGRRSEPSAATLRRLAFEALRRIAKPRGDGTGVLTANTEGEIHKGWRINGHAFVWVPVGTRTRRAFFEQFVALTRRHREQVQRSGDRLSL